MLMSTDGALLERREPSARNVCPIEVVITAMAGALVEDRSALCVYRKVIDAEGFPAIQFYVSVARGDVGKVLGREGRIANAIRTVAKAAGMTHGHRKVFIEFVEADA